MLSPSARRRPSQALFPLQTRSAPYSRPHTNWHLLSKLLTIIFRCPLGTVCCSLQVCPPQKQGTVCCSLQACPREKQIAERHYRTSTRPLESLAERPAERTGYHSGSPYSGVFYGDQQPDLLPRLRAGVPLLKPLQNPGVRLAAVLFQHARNQQIARALDLRRVFRGRPVHQTGRTCGLRDRGVLGRRWSQRRLIERLHFGVAGRSGGRAETAAERAEEGGGRGGGFRRKLGGAEGSLWGGLCGGERAEAGRAHLSAHEDAAGLGELDRVRDLQTRRSCQTREGN